MKNDQKADLIGYRPVSDERLPATTDLSAAPGSLSSINCTVNELEIGKIFIAAHVRDRRGVPTDL